MIKKSQSLSHMILNDIIYTEGTNEMTAILLVCWKSAM